MYLEVDGVEFTSTVAVEGDNDEQQFMLKLGNENCSFWVKLGDEKARLLFEELKHYLEDKSSRPLEEVIKGLKK